MESTTVTQAPNLEGPSPRKTRKAAKKQRDEGSDISGAENRQPDTAEQPSDLRSETPPQQVDDERSVVENLTSSVIMPAPEARPTPTRPSNRSSSRTKHSSGDPQKARVANLVSRAFQGQAPELMEAVEGCEVCFPCVLPEVISVGPKQLPGAEILQEVLQQFDANPTPATAAANDTDAKDRNAEFVRDTVFAGAMMGSSEILEACLKNGADLTISNANGRNIFHCLAATGDAPLLRKVLRRIEKTHGRIEERKATSGSRPDVTPDKPNFAQLINQVDYRGWTPLLTAVARCNEEAVEAILTYPQVNLDTQLAHTCPPNPGQEPVHSNALHIAALRGHVGIAKRLIAHGAPFGGLDSMRRNLFHYAAALSDIELACSFFDAMSKECQFDPRMLMELDRHHRSPIFVAIAWGNVQLAEKMIHHVKTASLPAQVEGNEDRPFSLIECVLCPDSWGLTSMHVAQLRRHYPVLFRVAKLWATYRSAEDPANLVEALRTRFAADLTVPMNGSKALELVVSDKKNFGKWIEADLNAMERATYNAIRCTFSEFKSTPAPSAPPDLQLMKAIRRLGPEICLRACSKATESLDKLTAVPPRGPSQKRSSNEIAFYRTLRELVMAEYSSTEARAALTFVLGENYNKNFSSGGPTEKPAGAQSMRTASGQVTRRGAEKQPIRPNAGGLNASRGSGFAAPLTGASPRTALSQSGALYSSGVRNTPDRNMTERKPAPSAAAVRPSPPHVVAAALPTAVTTSTTGASRYPRSATVKVGGSPGFMSMTRSSANLFRNTTAPRPPSKGSAVNKTTPPSIRSSQAVAKPTHRAGSGKRVNSTNPMGSGGDNANVSATSQGPPCSPAPEDFEAPNVSEISFESNSESRSIQAA